MKNFHILGSKFGSGTSHKPVWNTLRAPLHPPLLRNANLPLTPQSCTPYITPLGVPSTTSQTNARRVAVVGESALPKALIQPEEMKTKGYFLGLNTNLLSTSHT